MTDGYHPEDIDLSTIAAKPETALRQPEWGRYVWRLEAALRNAIATNRHLTRDLQSVDAEEAGADA